MELMLPGCQLQLLGLADEWVVSLWPPFLSELVLGSCSALMEQLSEQDLGRGQVLPASNTWINVQL